MKLKTLIVSLFFTIASIGFPLSTLDPQRSVLAAIGDTIAICSSVASLATLDVQPTGADEWVIHNIWFEYDVELQRYDGTNVAVIKQFIGGDWQNFEPAIRVRNGNRIRVKNLHGSLAKVICYDGVQTK